MKKTGLIILLLLLINASLIFFLIIYRINNHLKIVACDVGQGDSFLITYSNFQVLIDGGPDESLLSCISNNIPYWENTIDIVILTHPQADHYSGLINVFQRFRVNYFIKNKDVSSSQKYQLLEKIVGGKGVKMLEGKNGLSIRYGLIYLDILYPNGIGGNFRSDPNNNSIVFKLNYKKFDALFTGDMDFLEYDNDLSFLKEIKLDYLKVSHHGSKNGIREFLFEYISPTISVISVGKNNRYGHPDDSVIEMLRSYNTIIKRTDIDSTVILVTDGINMGFKNVNEFKLE